MALWGTDETNTSVAGAAEQKPTWQKDRDPNGSKGRPAINEEQILLQQIPVGFVG